jgi:hypothetical protein
VDVDTVFGFHPGAVADKIHFNSGAIVVAGVHASTGAGDAALAATGFATFNVADTTFAQHITAVASALAGAAAGTAVVWTETAQNGQGNTYLYMTDGFAGASSNDVLVQLVGTTATAGTGITVAGGDITAIA